MGIYMTPRKSSTFVLYFFGHTRQQVRFWLPHWGLNLYPLQWKRGPSICFFKTSFHCIQLALNMCTDIISLSLCLVFHVQVPWICIFNTSQPPSTQSGELWGAGTVASPYVSQHQAGASDIAGLQLQDSTVSFNPALLRLVCTHSCLTL